MNIEIKTREFKETFIPKLGQNEPIELIIPDCCRLGLPDCPHRIKPAKLKRQNKGL